MARSRRRRGSTVLPLNVSRGSSQRTQGRPAVASSLASSKKPSLEGDLAAAVAPQQSVLGSGPLGTLTPNVQDYAPEGAPGAYGGESTQLIDTLAQEPAPIEVSGPAEVGVGAPLGAATGGPYGGTSGNPAADAALMQAESIYGTPGNESPLAAATQSSMLGSSPGASLADIVPGYGGPSDDMIATYNRNKLLRMLMEEGY